MSVGLSLIAGAGWQFFDNNGVPLAGGKLFVYGAGTTTKSTTYTTSAGSTPNTNPIVLDAAGRVSNEIWLTTGSSYKFVLSPSTDTDPPTAAIWTKDNIPVANDGSGVLAELANTTDNSLGDALIGFRQSNASGFLTGSVGRTLNDKMQEFVNVKDFGAVGDGVTDDTAAINAALAASKAVYFGDSNNTYRINGTLNITQSNSWLRGDGAAIYAPANASFVPAVQAAGALSNTTTNTSNIYPEDFSITVVSSSGFAENDWVLISSNDLYTSYSGGGSYYAGEIIQLRSVSGTTVYTCTPVIGQYINSPSITKINFVNDINISGLRITGGNIAGNYNIGLKFNYVNGFSVWDCEFLYQDFHQINITSSIRGNVYDNMFTGVLYDGSVGSSFYSVVAIDATQWLNVENNIFNLGRAGVTTTKNGGTPYYGQPLFINIHHNQMFDASAGGAGRANCYQHHGFGRFVNFNNNFADGGYTGVTMYGGANVNIFDNVITNISQTGIELGYAGTYLSSIVVSGNYISGGALTDFSGVKYGIWAGKGSGLAQMNDVTISNNKIVGFVDSSGVGIRLLYSPSSFNNDVRNNTVSSGTAAQETGSDYGIAIESPETTVTGNVVINYKNGIKILANNCIVANNNIRFGAIGSGIAAAGTYGVYVKGADHISVSNNQIYNSYYGIYAGETSVMGFTNITNNVIDTCYVGVTTTANVVGPAVLNNFVRGASSAGYSLTSSTGAGGVTKYSGSGTDSNTSI